MQLPFDQVDVFTAEPFLGNPVAVVHDADGLTTEQMRAIAVWTNLSETTFLLSPTKDEADYRVRIFSLSQELPFAGHPTLGTCHAWLGRGGTPATAGTIVQECELGLVPIRDSDDRLAFAAPPRYRSGPVDDADLATVVEYLGVERDEIVDAAWCDNGPGWIAVMLGSADRVNALAPAPTSKADAAIGVVGPHPAGSELGFEVRAFFTWGGAHVEDPVTGSLNAALAQWFFESGRVDSGYVASQGTTMGRAGRVVVEPADGELWIGGNTVTCIEGSIAV